MWHVQLLHSMVTARHSGHALVAPCTSAACMPHASTGSGPPSSAGVFEDAIAIASYFLDDDSSGASPNPHIVETVRNVDPVSHRNIIDNVWTVGMLPSEVFPRHAWGLTNRPVAVITNNGSASASEVLAGALQVRSSHTGLGVRNTAQAAQPVGAPAGPDL